ncbi:predicted protein [Sclerotinia sclerotiorum 1980 UF-70]|uniref:Uncharacterized protein n=1 Tax=Sclerotinia sclerotiorum (strain ATCC 18683 / 1980 / Ss-1) TaxID=665079 RepID=A7E9C7_SCLS1|nr:predicted protein [Sclerotinia sclerotiorum 1980 UF-70]EDN96979.1 predicted protein [Sclerotinia sclerotiorum 1980 UF-70]
MATPQNMEISLFCGLPFSALKVSDLCFPVLALNICIWSRTKHEKLPLYFLWRIIPQKEIVMNSYIRILNGVQRSSRNDGKPNQCHGA